MEEVLIAGSLLVEVVKVGRSVKELATFAVEAVTLQEALAVGHAILARHVCLLL